jgi:hypothetical protein
MAKPVRCFLLIIIICRAAQGNTQSYHAFNGSSYAGVTAMYNNPAAIVNQAYKWDITLLGMQATVSNTAFTIHHNSLLNTQKSSVNFTEGLRPRYFHTNIDVNLLNVRYTINAKNAVAIGLRFRTYNHVNAAPFNFNDTISHLQSFLHANNNVNFFDGSFIHTGWAEINMNYARVVFQSSTSSLSAGIALSYLKCLSGGYGVFSHINYTEFYSAKGSYYILNQAAVTAAYSANYLTNNNNSTSQKIHDFISNAPSSVGFDLGVEYLINNSLAGDNKPADATNYDWKIGVSAMDIGHNSFNPIQGSFKVTGPFDFSDTILEQKFGKAKNIRDISDSVGTLFGNYNPLAKKFTISLPARLVISIDKSLGSHFFTNAELSLNLYSTQTTINLHTREVNLITITPRWETQAWGIYMPVQYNSQGQFWVGAAVKLGPLLLGVHSLNITKWFKTGDQTYNGGGYILLSIHPFKKPVRAVNGLDCPK